MDILKRIKERDTWVVIGYNPYERIDNLVTVVKDRNINESRRVDNVVDPIEFIEECKDDVVFVYTHENIGDELKKRDIPYVLCYPEIKYINKILMNYAVQEGLEDIYNLIEGYHIKTGRCEMEKDSYPYHMVMDSYWWKVDDVINHMKEVLETA